MRKMMICATMACAFAGGAFATMDDDSAIEIASATLAKMTLEEKALLCAGNGTMTLSAIPRVGIAREWRMSDSSHTVRANGNRWEWGYDGSTNDFSTVLPTCSALASTWNRDLAYAHGDVVGAECVSRGVNQILGPGVNIMRTPLCGRNWEYMTEDPFLAAAMVVPLIEGIQSHDVAATVKHFCLNGQENDRNNVDTVCDERTLNEIYLPAFRAAVKEAKTLCLMTSYNKYNGEWLSENAYLQRGILRDRWGFLGEIVTDWGGQHSCEKAALNGCGIEMNRGPDIRYLVRPWDIHEGRTEGAYPLADAVREGRVPAAVLDEMAMRTLFVMAKTGFLGGGRRGPGERNSVRHQNIARSIGEEAITLLKNDDLVLPLKPEKMRKIVLIGSLATLKHAHLGWSAEGKPLYEISPAEGIREYFTNRHETVEIVTAPLIASDEEAVFHPIPEDAISTFDTSRKDAGFEVKSWETEFWQGDDIRGASVASGFSRKCDEAWAKESPCPGKVEGVKFAVRFKTRITAPETGKYVFMCKANRDSGTRIILDGKTLSDDWAGARFYLNLARIELAAGKEYELVFEYRTGKEDNFFAAGWQLPSEQGMTVADVRTAAKDADAVIVFTGTTIGHGRAMECEGGDRPNLLLPEGHDEAIGEILKWGCRNLVVVNHSGSPVEMPWVDACPTLVQMPYLGQEAGRPLARVLFGDVNPSGRLPCSWPRRLADTAVSQKGTMTPLHSIFNEGLFVGYRWHDKAEIAPMFPFGFGLGYTRYEYQKPKAEPQRDGTIAVSVEVTNAGAVRGKETVQVYVAYPGAKVERPLRELKGFAKVDLEPGDTKRVVVKIAPRDLAYWDSIRHRFRTDAGRYDFLIGSNSRDIRSRISVDVDKDTVFAD